jgi:hypothetical protein
MALENLNDYSQSEKDRLKIKAIQLNKKIVKSGNFTNGTNMVMGDSMFSTYVYTNSEVSRENAITLAHPIFNSTDCEDFLIKAYNLTSPDEIVYITNKINSTLNTFDTDSYTYSAYDGITGEKLDLDLCNNLTYSVQMPISNKSEVNLTLYKELKDQGIDIFNPNDPAFTDRCFTHIDNQTGGDTTLNYRKQKYLQQNVPICMGINCTYKGISEFDYVECTCTGLVTDNELINTLVNTFMSAVSKFNIGVIFCYKTILSVIFYLI